MHETTGSERFDFPQVPEYIAPYLIDEARSWQGLDEFDILVRAEEACGHYVELQYVDLPYSVWGIHIVRGEQARLCINQWLPPTWRRFALFHELYHLLMHPRGEEFWSSTFESLSRYEQEADHFAWAVLQPEWIEQVHYG